MAGELQPLGNGQAIVDKDGKPTLYFTRWAQQRQMDIGAGQTAYQVAAAIVAALTARKINTAGGLAGGGDLSANLTLSLADTGVEAGQYGDASHAIQLTVDAKGRITAIDVVDIVPEAPQDGKFYCRQNGAWVAVNVQPA